MVANAGIFICVVNRSSKRLHTSLTLHILGSVATHLANFIQCPALWKIPTDRQTEVPAFYIWLTFLFPSFPPSLPPSPQTHLSLSQVEKIRQLKAKSLYLQVEKLHQNLTKLDSTIAAVGQVLDEGRQLDVLLARERMLTQIQELKSLRGLLQPQEDDRFMFTPPDQVGPSAALQTS